MRALAALAVALLSSTACLAEDKPALTPEKAQALLKEEHKWAWELASIEEVAGQIRRVTGLPVRISGDLAARAKKGDGPKVSLLTESSLEAALELAAASGEFAWYLEETTVVLETQAESLRRVVKSQVDVTGLLESSRPAKEVQAMPKAKREVYERELLKETRDLAGEILAAAKDSGNFDPKTCAVTALSGRVEIVGNRRFVKEVEDLIAMIASQIEGK